MGISKSPLTKFRSTDIPLAEVASPNPDDQEVVQKKNHAIVFSEDSDQISQDAQAGVQGVEAMTKVWTKSNLVLAYIT